MAKYYQESPEITKNIDWDTILNNVPSTNIGMVPFQYETQLPFLSGKPRKLDYNEVQEHGVWEFPSVPTTMNTGYALPGDPRVRDSLNESVNTELNLDNRSNKFFPYEKDYSGIMAARALQEGGDPIFDTARMDPSADFSNIPPSMRADAEYTRPGSDARYGVQTTWPPFDAPDKFTVGLNVPMLSEDKGSIDSTLLHEARHYYQSKYGFDIYKLNEDEMHNVIYQFQGMNKNPVDPGRIPSHLSKKEAAAYLDMHKQGKQWYYNQGQGFGLTKGEALDKRLRENYTKKQERERLQGDYHKLMMAGQDKLGHTYEQSMNQFDRMYGYAPGHRGQGDYTRPTMTQQQMGREAQETGGGVNPHEATRAEYQEPAPDRNPRRPGYNEGGIAGLPGGQWSSSTIEGDEEIYDIKPLQMDPGIMSIEDLEDLFEEAGLDKSIIYKLINSGGLSQLLS